MNNKQTTQEWIESDNWDELVGSEGGYILGVGYCYVKQLATVFKKNNKRYHYFQTKWGRCGTSFLFSALLPDAIIMPVAWGNAIAICKENKTLFRIWAEITRSLVELNVPILAIDMPAAWHLSELAQQMGGLSNAESRINEQRKLYYNKVISPFLHYSNFCYIDLQDILKYDSKFIFENIKEPKVLLERSPWHMSQNFIDIIGEFFLKFLEDPKDNNMDSLRKLLLSYEN